MKKKYLGQTMEVTDSHSMDVARLDAYLGEKIDVVQSACVIRVALGAVIEGLVEKRLATDRIGPIE